MEKYTCLGALIGLAGAFFNNGKTETTDSVVLHALSSEDSEEELAAVHAEKFKISPTCETCETPCGNTSDFDVSQALAKEGEVADLKREIVAKLKEYAVRETSSGSLNGKEVPESVYKAVSYLKYDLKAESYRLLLKEAANW